MASKKNRGTQLGNYLTGPVLDIFNAQGGAAGWEGRRKDYQLTDADLLKMQYDWNTIQDERAYNEEWYNAHQSYSAQVREMEEAGLNPALMYGGAMQPSGGSVSGSADSSNATGSSGEDLTGMFEGLVNMLMGGLDFANTAMDSKSQRDLNSAQAENQLASAEAARQAAEESRTRIPLIRAQADYQDYLNGRQPELDDAKLNLISSEIKKNFGQVSLMSSHEKLNDSQILVNESTIKLNDQNISESQSRIALNIANKFLSEAKEFEIGYMLKARKEFMDSHSEQARADADLKTLNWLKEHKLIDEGYYDELIKATKQGRINQTWSTALDGIYKGIDASLRIGAAVITYGGSETVRGAFTNPSGSAPVLYGPNGNPVTSMTYGY